MPEALPDFAEFTLAGKLMAFFTHPDVVLWCARRLFLVKECVVSTVQDVNIRIGQIRVGMDVDFAVHLTHGLGHCGSAVGRVLAVQNKGCTSLREFK